ncbi:MAG TPA: sigma-70 family RNA polymerase sigma factor [Phycisphaerales bacterium]|nr:sigma-70 family RNA polymerase sigma factor [Phycisphaerales bacterium]HMP38158.1 sigma-70 family RNA polymerase sigma factor [Phycisphaerales bacterium]
MPADRTAFEILIREHSEMLMAYLRSLVDDEEIVEEAFQQAVIDTWRSLDQFDRSRPFGPWLRGIARHRMLVLLRSRGRLRRRLAEFERVVAARFALLEQRSGDTFAERLAALRECLAALPDGQRDAIDLVYARERDTRAAATALGLDWETVRKRVQRARGALAECLRARGILPEPTA